MPGSLIGQTISQFELESILGEGGQATVYKAYQPNLDRWAAIKVLHSGYREVLVRFEREAKTIARLQHPNILTIYEYGDEDGYPYIAMEYVGRGTLKDDLLDQSMDWINALKLIISLAEALDHAHQQGLVHRDIKPSNILMPQKDWPLLADFGLVKVKNKKGSSITDSGLVIGTPAYMPPEQANSEKVDARADVYALGILAFEMITGRLPFVHKNPSRMMMAHISEPLPSPSTLNPNCPPVLEAVILKATAKSLDDRYSDMKAMADALKEVAGSATAPMPTFKFSPESATPLETSPKISIRGQGPRAATSVQKAQVLLKDKNLVIDLLDPDKEGLIVGRSTGSTTVDIDLGPHDATNLGLSRRHAKLTKQANQWYIEDLNSLNYTFLNDVQLKPGQSQGLKNGDVIHCAQLSLIFLLT